MFLKLWKSALKKRLLLFDQLQKQYQENKSTSLMKFCFNVWRFSIQENVTDNLSSLLYTRKTLHICYAKWFTKFKYNQLERINIGRDYLYSSPGSLLNVISVGRLLLGNDSSNNLFENLKGVIVTSRSFIQSGNSQFLSLEASQVFDSIKEQSHKDCILADSVFKSTIQSAFLKKWILAKKLEALRHLFKSHFVSSNNKLLKATFLKYSLSSSIIQECR